METLVLVPVPSNFYPLGGHSREKPKKLFLFLELETIWTILRQIWRGHNQSTNLCILGQTKISVAQIRDVYPGSEFFHPGSRVKNALNPGSGPETLNWRRILIFLSQKIYTKVLKKWSGMFNPDPGTWIRIFFLSRIPASKKHQILDLDPQHCKNKYKHDSL